MSSNCGTKRSGSSTFDEPATDQPPPKRQRLITTKSEEHNNNQPNTLDPIAESVQLTFC